ncbi:Metal tolerance protein 4 [Symbiodinium microadriaticum]|uniref:Metal tolerance protein 4 n=1 Tax=Symbiodinium microadriaticum TaxID=2951 RepID=A0A1Q9EDM3_SYMMI|nr:Metal tolerance protein 4 [Symbiodinium microadriaticum]
MAGVKDGREDLTSPLLLASPGGSISATVFSPGGHVKKVEVQSGNDPSGSCLSAILSSTSGTESSEVMLVIQSSVWINFVLMLCKLYTFLVSGSLAVLASLVDSIIDLLGQGALMLTSFLARQSGHEEYPVGRGRLEPVGVMICAVVMGMASMEVISQSSIKLIKYWDRDDAPAAVLTETAVVVLVFIVFLKAGLWYWCSNVAKRNPNVDAVKAIAQDNMNDVISNIAALIAPEMIVLGYQFWVIDPLAGIGISIYIIYTWILTGFEQVEMIVGKKADPDFLQKVFSIVEGHDQRMQLDQLSAYHFGPKYLVELEVVMPESTTLRDSHDCGILLQHKIETLELYGGPCRTSPRAEGAKLTFQRSGELLLKESEPTEP